MKDVRLINFVETFVTPRRKLQRPYKVYIISFGHDQCPNLCREYVCRSLRKNEVSDMKFDRFLYVGRYSKNVKSADGHAYNTT